MSTPINQIDAKEFSGAVRAAIQEKGIAGGVTYVPEAYINSLLQVAESVVDDDSLGTGGIPQIVIETAAQFPELIFDDELAEEIAIVVLQFAGIESYPEPDLGEYKDWELM